MQPSQIPDSEAAALAFVVNLLAEYGREIQAERAHRARIAERTQPDAAPDGATEPEPLPTDNARRAAVAPDIL